jgi:hypothetical protein
LKESWIVAELRAAKASFWRVGSIPQSATHHNSMRLSHLILRRLSKRVIFTTPSFLELCCEPFLGTFTKEKLSYYEAFSFEGCPKSRA